MKTIAVLTGAGISAESGLQTFRDADGLWEGHDVHEVASIEGFLRKPALVLEFYNQRRKQLQEVEPNVAHQLLVDLEENYEVHIITQNVDDLHERAGSTSIVHLHGELMKVHPVGNGNDIREWTGDLVLGDVDEQGVQLRPFVVWFGEAVPMLDQAIQIVERADLLLIIGTSLKVYPAANLIHYVSNNTPIVVIDPKPNLPSQLKQPIKVINEVATVGMQHFLSILPNELLPVN